MTVKELLRQCQHDKTAVLATNFYNFETLTAVLEAAKKMEAPVMLQLTKGSIDYMGLNVAVKMARQAIADYGLEGFIHLDHGPSLELVQKCLDAGFDSVMIDASEKPFDENIETTCKAVEMSKPYGVNVESELGYVAKLGQEQGGGFTTPEQAKTFVDATGVDALAVSIGSAHGFYKLPPHLDIPRLAAIHAATPVCLVLHGSSGIPHPMVREAIANGIVKVNLATEIKDTFMRALKGLLSTSDEIDLRKVFPKAVDPVVSLLCEKYRMVGSAKIK
ncbi:MAG: class II fructose-bisphosphate aldolase [Bacteroidales bacterium]